MSPLVLHLDQPPGHLDVSQEKLLQSSLPRSRVLQRGRATQETRRVG